jgi:hypothetical protein
MNVIIPPSHNQQSHSEQYQEVVNDLGCGYYAKYTLINGKKMDYINMEMDLLFVKQLNIKMM